MLTLEEIMAKINLELSALKININENDVQEGFKRPSFFVKFDTVYRTDYKDCFHREITVILYFFPSDRYKYQLEVLDIQQKVEDIMRSGFIVKDRVLNISQDIEATVIDGVLQMVFQLSFYDTIDDSGVSAPLMEELYFNE
jgi:hypothetical protein